MKFKDMPYQRPDKGALIREMEDLICQMQQAASKEEVVSVFEAFDKLRRHIRTLATLASIRHSINTKDGFYDAEAQFWNETGPELEEYETRMDEAILESPYSNHLGEVYGDIILINAKIAKKAFSPEIISELQQENKLVQTYEKLLASAQVAFEGNTYNLEQMVAFKTDQEDARRLQAWQAEGQWYMDHAAELDDLYDQLVQLRTKMAKKMGYASYTELGYWRMQRNCYTREDVEAFRNLVVTWLVPVATDIFRKQAELLGKSYPMNYADNALTFRSGNPRPKGDAKDLVEAGKRFYEALSPETGEFFNKMIEDELMDLLATDGKRPGGYMTELPDYEVPFIFANFNGTEHDVDVITHEAGHAFAGYLNRKRVPISTMLPTMEGCEVHSMSMEFFAEAAAEAFFGEDAAKFRYSHLTKALKFIPYGTMVDHFQHIVYDHPDYTPKQRHEEWRRLQDMYMPWIKQDEGIPFYSAGRAWQRQHHIYSMPFYYIDYCLAQTVALFFWARIQEDQQEAWERYMAYTRQGGGDTFTNILEQAGIDSPFRENMLKTVCTRAKAYLDAYDLTGIA